VKPFLYKPDRHWKDIELWKDVTEEQWNDWIWQLTNTIRTLEDLSKMTQAEVVGLHGMGPKALERIQLALTETNLSFKSDSE